MSRHVCESCEIVNHQAVEIDRLHAELAEAKSVQRIYAAQLDTKDAAIARARDVANRYAFCCVQISPSTVLRALGGDE